MQKNDVCFIGYGRSIELLLNRDRILCEHFTKVFEGVYILDVYNIFTTGMLSSYATSRFNCDDVPENIKVVCPKNLKQCKDFLKSHNMIAIHYFSQKWHDWWLYHYLKKYSIPLLYIHTLAWKGGFQLNKSKNILKYFLSISGLLQHRIFVRLTKWGLLPKVDTYYTAEKSRVQKVLNSKRYNEVVLVNSSFYDSMLIKKIKVSNDYIVFVDSMPPYHGDQVSCGYELMTPSERESYYKRLNWILDTIASEAGGKEVVICLHPSYNEENLQSDYGARKAVKYMTDEYIAKAEIVLFHESSAINSVFVHDKKVIQLLNSRFNDFIKRNCEVYTKLCNFPALDMYDCDEGSIRGLVRTLKVDREKYEEYLSNNIVASGEKGVCSCEQIAGHISRKYGIPKRDEDNDGLPPK